MRDQPRGRPPAEHEEARRSPSQDAKPKRFIGNSSAPAHSVTKLRAQAVRRLRRQRMAEIVLQLRPRAFFEFVDELDRHFDIPDLDRWLDRYADLDSDILRSLDADKFPAPVTRLVPE
jgi:hypothetical protein